MLGRWMKKLLWHPFEVQCRIAPLVRLTSTVTQPLPGLRVIRVGNFITRWLGAIAGFEYSICYVLDNSIVIDTGFGWARNALRATIKELGLDQTVRIVVNTHYHEDHVGNNDLFSQLTEVSILAHRDAISEIRYPFEKAWYRRFLFGPSETVAIGTLGTEVGANGTVLEVIDTPGHCPGHVCFFEPKRRWLFSGDLFISAQLDSQLADADGPLWIVSLDRIIALHPECMFDGHGAIFIGQDKVLEQLQLKRQFLMALQQKIAECATQAQSVEEITRKVFQSESCSDALSLHEGWMSLLTASDFSRSNLVRSFLREITAANSS
jgi:glyoxylase-like metal-dependent hydrolase (beta-lactamase superfamily II)